MPSRNQLGTGAAFLMWVFASLATAPRATATDPADLCTGNPCIISSDVTIDPIGQIDFGPGTQLRLAAGVRLTVGPGATSSEVSVSAGSIILEPGSEIVGREGFLTLDAVAGNLEYPAERGGGEQDPASRSSPTRPRGAPRRSSFSSRPAATYASTG